MAEKSNVNFLSDVLLPIFAFVSAASGPYGAAGAQALTGALGVGQRRRAGERQEQRQDQLLGQRQQELEFRQQQAQQQAQAQRPQRDLEAAQNRFQLGNLLDVESQLGATVPSRGATQALGEPQTRRLQSALGRGEQVPLPQEAPSPQVRQQRFQGLATTPGGAAQLTAAGLGEVAQRTASFRPEEEDPRQFAQDKRQALGIIGGFQQGEIPPDTANQLKRQITQARTQQDLTEAVAAIPLAAGAPKGSIEEQVFRELAPELGPLEALQAVRRREPQPERPGEAELRQARIQKLRSETERNQQEATGQISPQERRKLQLQVRGDIRQEPVYKDYQNALGGYTAVSVGAKRGDAQGDLAILNGIVRLLDPGSVVRPSEFETARRAQGLIEQLEVLIPRIQQGEILNPDTRQRYLSLANELLSEYSNTATQEVGQVYGSLIQDTGLSLGNVFVQPRPIPSPEAGGTVQAPPGSGPEVQTPSVPAFTIKGVREKGS